MPKTSQALLIGYQRAMPIDPEVKASFEAQGYGFVALEDLLNSDTRWPDLYMGPNCVREFAITKRAQLLLIAKAERALAAAKVKAQKAKEKAERPKKKRKQ